MSWTVRVGLARDGSANVRTRAHGLVVGQSIDFGAREELQWAVKMMNEVAASIADHPTKPRLGVHVCRGNWSTREETLLVGNYAPLAPWLERLQVNQLVLEYATPRAGDLIPFGDKELGLGAVNPRTTEVESPDEICTRIDEALVHWAPDRLFLNPDCGFATFSEREMNSEAIASAKMSSLGGCLTFDF